MGYSCFCMRANNSASCPPHFAPAAHVSRELADRTLHPQLWESLRCLDPAEYELPRVGTQPWGKAPDTRKKAMLTEMLTKGRVSDVTARRVPPVSATREDVLDLQDVTGLEMRVFCQHLEMFSQAQQKKIRLACNTCLPHPPMLPSARCLYQHANVQARARARAHTHTHAHRASTQLPNTKTCAGFS